MPPTSRQFIDRVHTTVRVGVTLILTRMNCGDSCGAAARQFRRLPRGQALLPRCSVAAIATPLQRCSHCSVAAVAAIAALQRRSVAAIAASQRRSVAASQSCGPEFVSLVSCGLRGRVAVRMSLVSCGLRGRVAVRMSLVSCGLRGRSKRPVQEDVDSSFCVI